DSAVVEALKEIKRIRNEKVTKETLDIAKAKYAGSFVLALERPQTIANYALNIELNDLDEDFYKDYLKNINAVTIEDIQRVANKYFIPENSRIVIAGKGSEVIENLEKTGLPIVYYDRFANKVEKPSYSKEIPEGVNGKTVLDNYLKAIGGKDELSSVKSIYSVAEVSIKNVPMKLSAEMKSMVPNKESMEMSVEGMGVMMKQKFNGEKGYTEQQGQRMELGEDEIAAKKAERSIFPELHYTPEMVSLEALTTIEGEDLYKLKVKLGDKESFRYYDLETGLLKRVETTIEAQGQKMTSTVIFDDYKEVNGIMMPMSQHVESGPQIVDLAVTSILINEKVTEEDFK
ncbi:MAG: insulinase family protein, partial [Flavobacteriaceae bacterium]|nr:insulinase family protein [Flavobacteriaceae bacterium]